MDAAGLQAIGGRRDAAVSLLCRCSKAIENGFENVTLGRVSIASSASKISCEVFAIAIASH